MQSCFYEGLVTHRRFRPKSHHLRYNVCAVLLNLDELESLDSSLLGFSYHHWAPMAFHDRDHGPLDGSPLRPWVQTKLREAGLLEDCKAITILCYPRLFGYVFDPLSIYFCYDQDNALFATLYEVCNTYSERHTYVIPVELRGKRAITQTCPKKHYVSPFIDMSGTYKFTMLPPDNKMKFAIRYEDNNTLVLAASFVAQATPLSSASVIKFVCSSPFQSFKVILGIHFEALKMWIQRFPVFSHTHKSERATSSAHVPSREKDPIS